MAKILKSMSDFSAAKPLIFEAEKKSEDSCHKGAFWRLPGRGQMQKTLLLKRLSDFCKFGAYTQQEAIRMNTHSP
jgi:hypothetical protein